jgi:predicted small secreted protein
MLKFFNLGLILLLISSCGTIGGTISGFGEDIKSVGDFIKSD